MHVWKATKLTNLYNFYVQKFQSQTEIKDYGDRACLISCFFFIDELRLWTPTGTRSVSLLKKKQLMKSRSIKHGGLWNLKNDDRIFPFFVHKNHVSFIADRLDYILENFFLFFLFSSFYLCMDTNSQLWLWTFHQ